LTSFQPRLWQIFDLYFGKKSFFASKSPFYLLRRKIMNLFLLHGVQGSRLRESNFGLKKEKVDYVRKIYLDSILRRNGSETIDF
jgi:hypothetical protein